MTADMQTWHKWGEIEAFEDPDGQLGHVFDYVWEALDVECPAVNDEGHGKGCRLCMGGGLYTPDWAVPEYSGGWPEWEDTAMKQGWNNDTVKEVALGFIRNRREIHKFERYCKQLADQENAMKEESQ